MTLLMTEIEFVSLTECAEHNMWLQKLLGKIFRNKFMIKINHISTLLKMKIIIHDIIFIFSNVNEKKKNKLRKITC